MSQPWMKFYPSDWRADPALRMCSLAARGLWMEMLCVMHEATPCGSLVINGRALAPRQIASLAGTSLDEAVGLLAELEESGVFGRDDDGTIFSRRIRRDVEKAARDRENGQGGGNPNLKPKSSKGVNPPDNTDRNGEDKAQIPDTRSQKKDNPPPSRVVSPATRGGEGDVLDCFEKIIGAYPKSKTISQPKVLALLMALSSADREAAAHGCKAYAEEFRAKPTTNPIGLEKFIRERIFDNFAAAPAAGETLVFVPIDTPEWSAWDAHYRATKGRGPPVVNGGWRFPTLTPPPIRLAAIAGADA